MEDFTTKPQIDPANTTSIRNSQGGLIFTQGIILRRVSKFMLGAESDGILPIPVFYDPDGKIFKESIPEDLRSEFSEDELC